MKKLKRLLTAAAGMVLMLALAGMVFAESPSEESRYVYYEDGLLDDNAYAVLNGRAAAVSEEYDSGVYMVMVENYREWDNDLDRAAQYIYEELELGMRNDQDGIMLLLSMEDRDYILLVHGVFANQAYNEYARDELADAFLDEFGENDFQAGFEDYIEECGHLLSLAADGTPLTRESSPYYNALKWLFSLGIGIAAGLVIAALIRSGMRNVAEKTLADHYVADNGADITLRRDQFTHMTHTRVKIEKHVSGHSGGGGGGGYSSSSGKF